MKYAIISGSHRHTSQSEKVAKFIKARLEALGQGASAEIIALKDNPLPLWDEGVWENSEKWQNLWGPISTKLKDADAFVVVSPEWGGMAPPGLKNFLLLCSSKEMAHKPTLLVAVSAGIGGSYPIAELRMSGYKNSYITYLPEHVIVRNAEKVLNEGSVNKELGDDKLRERMDYMLRMLEVYAGAFTAIRSTKAIELNHYPNGM